jgi:hypothetical protein
MSTDIIMVHQNIAQEFLQELRQAATAMQASSESLPVVVSAAAASRIAAMIEDATSKGGEMFYGGLPPSGQQPTQVIPTVISGLSHEMQLWTEEAFGPLVGITFYADENEAVQLVNSLGSGLSAAVYSRDLCKALALAKKIEAGYDARVLIDPSLLTHLKTGAYQLDDNQLCRCRALRRGKTERLGSVQCPGWYAGISDHKNGDLAGLKTRLTGGLGLSEKKQSTTDSSVQMQSTSREIGLLP